jgi:hypothetical protein
MLSLVLVASLSLSAVRPIRQLPMPTEVDVHRSGYLHDRGFDFLTTPGGLFRGEDAGDPAKPLELIAFPGKKLNRLLPFGSSLLLAKEGEEVEGRATEHTFLISGDSGTNWDPLDEGLEDCFAGFCRFLSATEVVPDPAHERIFLAAGGNLLATPDRGAPQWTILFGATNDGKPAQQTCPVVFEVIGDRVIMGGECPLDTGYIRIGRMRGDGKGWAEEPVAAKTPELENRNVQFIHHIADTNEVFAGIEGAVLRSSDGGESWRFVLHYELEDAVKYPYIQHFVEHRGMYVIAGFDKKDLKGYLAWSHDGERWHDASALVADSDAVTMLESDAKGRLLAVLEHGGGYTLSEVELRTVPRRRVAK